MTQRLPGVTVVAKRGRVHLITTADAGGCYELKNVPSGAYRVTARLTGFDNVTRDDVSIVTGSVARLDFAMRVSAICECVRVGGTTLAEQWDHADAVLHVRLAASESQPATPVGYYRHVATVIDALKKPAAPLETPLFVLQTQRSAAPGPYEIGQELVMLLRSSDSGGFMIATSRGWRFPAEVPILQSSFSFRTATFNAHRRSLPATSECLLVRFLTSCGRCRAATNERGYGR